MTAPTHVLALYEPSSGGEEALRRAMDLAARTGARLTVVTAAVIEPTDRKCCDIRSGYWNGVVREAAEGELARARTAVGPDAGARFRVVTGRSIAGALAHEAERCDADVVVLPRARTLLPWSRTRRARQIKRRSALDVVLA